MDKVPPSLTQQVQSISSNITGLTNDISSDLNQLNTAKRSKVTKYESTKRKLKLSAEQFHLYLNDTDSLFEYLHDEQLTKMLLEDASDSAAPMITLDQLLESVKRAKASHDKFHNICKEAEEKCRKGAKQCEAYSVLTDKKRSKRIKSGRNLIINQLLFAIRRIGHCYHTDFSACHRRCFV